MIINLYAIKDKFSGFMSPMMYVNDEVCKREFAFAMSRPGVMNFSAADFDLYRIGEIDNHSGRIKQDGPFEFICNGAEVIVNENKDSESK